MAAAPGLLGTAAVLQRRRIFRSAATPRRWPGVALLACLALSGGLALWISLPADLLGSAPPEGRWTAAPSEVRVVDGETLRLGERVVRLEGLEAPARGEICTDPAGRSFDCGAAAAERLARLVADRPLSCRLHGHDRFRRSLGTCEAGGAEVNAALVSGGWAVANSDDLSGAEGAARSSGRGFWTGGAVPPRSWRDR